MKTAERERERERGREKFYNTVIEARNDESPGFPSPWQYSPIALVLSLGFRKHTDPSTHR